MKPRTRIYNLYIGKQLKGLMNDKGLKYATLAKNIKLPYQNVVRLANNKITPTENELSAICSFFDIDSSYFGATNFQPKKELISMKEPEEPEEQTNVTTLSKGEYAPKLSEMPEMLSIKGIRNIGCATLRQAYKDAKRLTEYKDAKEFIYSSWCLELCEVLDIDYPSYRRSILKFATATEKLDNIISNARDFNECNNILDNLENTAKKECEIIGLNYDEYYKIVLDKCTASTKLNAIIDKAKTDEWEKAFIFAGSNTCQILCDKLNISYKRYQQRVIDTCRKTRGERLKMKYEVTAILYKRLDEFYLNDNHYGIAYTSDSKSETLELFNLHTRKLVHFKVSKDNICIFNFRKGKVDTVINCIDYRSIILNKSFVQVKNNIYYLS